METLESIKIENIRGTLPSIDITMGVTWVVVIGTSTIEIVETPIRLFWGTRSTKNIRY